MNFYRITVSFFLSFFFAKCRAQAIFSSHSELWKSNEVNLLRKIKQQRYVCQRDLV